MDWKVSFVPNDLDDLTVQELEQKVNPKVIMNVRVGRGRVGAGFPVLVENMSFTGHLRVKIKFMGRFPFAKLVDISFLEKPHFDYGLKPLGTDSFGFDVNIASIHTLLQYFINFLFLLLDSWITKFYSRTSTRYLGSTDVCTQCVYTGS